VPYALKGVRIAVRVIIALLVAYAVIFSLIGTFLLVWGASIALKPVMEVRRLATTNPTQSAFMADLRADLRREGKPDTLTHSFVPLDSISPNLVNAVIASEDDAFYTHPGFDITAILAAVEHNRVSPRSQQRGASTITQQLAKNLFLSGERSFRRKYAELGYAVLMEIFLGKERILELYLNYAQWGKTTFGCEAASQAYFGKPSSKLSLFESARLAAVLASPGLTHPVHSAFLGKRLFTIATNLYYKGQIGDSAFTALCGAPPPDADSMPRDSASADKRDAENNGDGKQKNERRHGR
jgi:monofunctional biosynthetic peptidoglycan transglycosylase